MKPKTVSEAYRRAVEVIALNDEPGELSLAAIAESISVCVVADAFDLKSTTVAAAVLQIRKQQSVRYRTGFAVIG